MKTKYNYFLLSGVLLSMANCSDERFGASSVMDVLYPVNLKASIEQVNITRADDSGFADGDRIGVYMVDFADGLPGTLINEGNHADNTEFVFNESEYSWKSNTSLYFTDIDTPADFYSYYPYLKEINNVTAVPFSIECNQAAIDESSKICCYEKSDLLWAKTSVSDPETNVINLNFTHIMAGVEVRLVEGDGFETGEWESLDKTVMIDGTIRNGLFDLSSGSITACGEYDSKAIIANPTVNGFRAVVIPQRLGASCNLMHINIGNTSYHYSRDMAMDYIGGKLHKFTFEVSKKKLNGDYLLNLLDESVTVWESDAESHEGVGRAYRIIDLGKEDRLEMKLKELNLSPKDIVNLKLIGNMDPDDFFFIRDNMRKLQSLNLKEVIINETESYGYYGNNIPNGALANCITLRHVVLPDKLTVIGDVAFTGAILEGSLKIPEGVKMIGNYAFTNWWEKGSGHSDIPDFVMLAHNNFNGTLEIPSSVEYIGTAAFRGCDFTGPLNLPSNLKYIGKNAFSGCHNFTGKLHFPDSLTEIEESGWSSLVDGEGVFYGMSGLVGSFELPKNLKVINGFGGIVASNIQMPENAIEIGNYAFNNAKVKGGIIIPDKVLSIGAYSFYACTAPYITLPSSLTRVREFSFAQCRNLTDTLTIPSNVEVIENNAYENCDKLTSLELPSKLAYIGDWAFHMCKSLEYIHCDAKEPPVIGYGAFVGIEKDNFTLEVPEESVDAYRNAPGWSEFRRISAYRNFVVRPSKYNVLNNGGKKEVILNADEDWELVECPDWCHVDKTSGNNKTVINLTVDRLEKGSSQRSGKIVFQLKSDKEYKTHINVGQYDYEHEEDSYVTLQKATKGAGIDLFLIGDGYDAADISSGLQMKDMLQTMEYFFAVEPYTTYREYFNVYTGIALSEDSGVEELNKWRNTKFHTVLPNTYGLRISSDWKRAFDYCSDICTPIVSKQDPMVGIILLANYDGYEGVTYSLGDSFCSVVTKSNLNYPDDARGLVQHEAGGHGIGWLADEYIYHLDFIQKCNCLCCEHVEELLTYQSYGFGLNVSLNGKYKDVPWNHLIFNLKYGDIVDLYEGGFFHKNGIYRSESNSCMNNNVPYFSSWSRQLIVQRIMKLAGEQFSLEKFYANDRREIGLDFTVSRSINGKNSTALHGNPPVFIKNYTFGQKGGMR